MSVIIFVLTVLVLFGKTSCDDIVRCIGESCFTIPAQTLSYDAANAWCRNNGSMLASVYDDNSKTALMQFLDSTQRNSMIFLQFKVFTSGDSWTLLNGTNYLGYVYNLNPSIFNFYAIPFNSFVRASDPKSNKPFVCEFDDSKCPSESRDVYLSNGRCYVKYETNPLNWFKARERCVNDGGDLAMVQHAESFVKNNWLTNPSVYLGIRWSNWSWRYSSAAADGINREMIYTYWSSSEPDNYTNKCVCADPQGSPKWSWSDCDCNTERPFVCVNASSTTTSFEQSNTPVSTATDEQENNTFSLHINKELAIGLGVGLGGAVLLAIVITLVVLLVKRRINRNANRMQSTSNELPQNQTSSNETLRRYEHLQSDGRPGKPDATEIYEQIIKQVKPS